MRYSLRQIYASRYEADRPVVRRLAERFVPINIISKALSPYSAFIFLNLGISADIVTFLSLAAVVTSAVLFILGYASLGIIAIFIFGLLDSTDGDVARVSGRTSYGGALDALGADFFYTFIPSSIGYFLFSNGVSLGTFSPQNVFTIAVFASLFFLLYRAVNTKRINFLIDHHKADVAYADLPPHQKTLSVKTRKDGKIMQSVSPKAMGVNSWCGGLSGDNEEKKKTPFFLRVAKLYRHVLIKDNFFSEPGLILWFAVFVFLEQWTFLAGYLGLILLYNLGFLISNFIKMYLTFLNFERQKSH